MTTLSETFDRGYAERFPPLPHRARDVLLRIADAGIAIIQGGGSARVSPHEAVTPLDGLRARFSDITVEHERGCVSYKRTPPIDARVLDGKLQVSYYAGREREGDPVDARKISGASDLVSALPEAHHFGHR